MTITLYGLKNCDTCKKALDALDGSEIEFVDIREDANLDRKVPEWLSALGVDAILNRRSTTWRNLSEADRAEAEMGGAIDVLIAHPTLIKRPVIEHEDEIYVGWTPDIEAALKD